MNQIPSEMSKVYDPSLVEERIYTYWMEGGYFQPKIDNSKEPFVIIMPPPNVTGQLHLGHALQATLADIMVRWHRMKGDPTLWLPGADHAGIATQVMVERNLAEEGITKQELGRDKFLQRVWDWVEKFGNTIDDQHKRLGASCDWTRRAFTLDEGPSMAVRETFSRLYKKGFIYRGERIINWCPRCSTALSDLEVDHQEEESFLYYINYGLEDNSGLLTVATTRPETLLGDTGLAVNPKDDRYRDLIGKNVLIPIINKPIPIIGDEAVDLEFGTGALKITPGHDPVDFEIAKRHGLPSVVVMDLDGTMNTNAGPYFSLDRASCRMAIINDLQESGLLSDMEPYVHSVGHCGRCSVSVEPIISKQWFVDTGELSSRAIKAVEEDRIKIIPERFERVYLNWMENIRDWCISRQLWWGHRIPAWYCLDCSEESIEILFRKDHISDGLIGGRLKELRCKGMSWEEIESRSSYIFVDLDANPIVSTSSPSSCNACGNSNLFQDPDVLDTWFSSALWPHSTLGWPEQTEDLGYFYPTSVMETAYDILLFWVARMIMMGLENTGEIPFRHVYLSGLIRDQDGAKMSKTKGNATDPIEAIEKFGTDALRFTLTTGNAPGNDLRLSESKLGASRNFVNKIWNASRYVMSNIQGYSSIEDWETPLIVNRQDRWIISRLNRLIHKVDRLMQDFLFGEAQKEIYDFFWNEYCDWYIEMAKLRIKKKSAESPLPVLVNVLEKTLRLMHPFIPFVTEEIWQSLMWKINPSHKQVNSLMVSKYPTYEEDKIQKQSELEIDVVMDIVRAIRNVRAEFKIDLGKPLGSVIQTDEFSQTLEEEKDVIKTLSKCDSLNFVDQENEMPSKDNAVSAILNGVTVLVPLEGLVDKDQELVRLEKELEDCSKNLGNLRNRLGNKDFIDKAPESVIQREKERMEALLERKERIQDFIKLLV